METVAEFRIIRISDSVSEKVEQDIKLCRGGISEFIAYRHALLDLLGGEFQSYVDRRADVVVDPRAYRHGAFLLQYAVSEAQRRQRVRDNARKPIETVRVHNSDLLNGFIQGKPGIFKGCDRFFRLLSTQCERYKESVPSMILFWTGIVDAAVLLECQKQAKNN